MADGFNDILRGFGNIGGTNMEEMADRLLNKRYQEAKKISNLTLYKMKSGKYKIKDYYGNDVYFSWVETEAKKKYIKLAGLSI